MSGKVTLCVVLCMAFVTTAAQAGSCPYAKKTCPQETSAREKSARDVKYQTGDSVKKKYGIGGKGASAKKVKVQTADDVLKQIEKEKKSETPTQPSTVAPAVQKTARRPRSPSMKPSSRAKRGTLPASPEVQQAMQGLLGHEQVAAE